MTPFEKLILPNGSVIPNRIAKAAMEESLADENQLPSEKLMRLYQVWADGGAGLLISGNVMVDRRAMTGPGAVVLEDESHLTAFERWARIGRSKGAQFWLQINHPGRQMQANLGQITWAPSAVPLDLGSSSKLFDRPVELTEEAIYDIIERFTLTAQLTERAGFTGVEVHAAHGYLLSQFLSPLTNIRQDQWGGSLDNRARLLLDIVRSIRAKVSAKFALAVKLNSADFQRGGFSTEDARYVVMKLNALNVDLVELSGGSYEVPAMQGRSRDGRTLAREAYFLEFAREIALEAAMPLMVTGGIRRREVAEQVLRSGVKMVGIGTALAIEPALPRAWQEGKEKSPELLPVSWKNKTLSSVANMAVVKYQFRRLSEGRTTSPRISPLRALLSQQVIDALRTRKYRRQMKLLSKQIFTKRDAG